MTDYQMAPSATLAAAQRAVAAAVEDAQRMGVSVCVAAVDSGGHLLAFARMDRAPVLCIQISQDKAFSVASFGGLPTSEWWRLLESEPALAARHHQDRSAGGVRRRYSTGLRRTHHRRHRGIRRVE